MYDLTYLEAMQKLEEGQAIKLPEWHGCWYKKDGKILVETRNGDILDTPYLEDYKYRTDWMTTDTLRDWQGIQYCLEAGKCIRRIDWPQGHFVFFRPKNVLPPEVVAKLHPIPEKAKAVLVAQGGEITFSGYYCKWDGGYVHNAWLPSAEDLRYDGWQMVNE